mgnify:CR=1 FL=1
MFDDYLDEGRSEVMKSQLTPLMRRKKMREGTQQTKPIRGASSTTKDAVEPSRGESAH